MKNLLLYLIFCFCFTGNARANDGPVNFTTRGLQFTNENRVKLTKEKIVIRVYSYKSLENLHYKADFDCTLYFENMSRDVVEANAAFPFREYFSQEILDYKILVDQDEISFRRQDYSKKANQEYATVFLSKISFQPETTTKVRHCYSFTSKDFGAPRMILEYIFSTGKYWRKSHTKCDIVLLLEEPMLSYIYLIEFDGFQVISGNRIEWHFKDLPEKDLYMEFADDRNQYLRYDLKVSSEEHELISYDDEDGYDYSKLESLLRDPNISTELQNLMLYRLSEHYKSDNPEKAIQYMKELADSTGYEDYHLLYNLIESLLEQENISDAEPYLKVLANQKDYPGFSIYAQLILRDHGLINPPLNLKFPKKGKFHSDYEYEPFSKSDYIIFAGFILFFILVLISIWKVIVWKLGRTIFLKKKC